MAQQESLLNKNHFVDLQVKEHFSFYLIRLN